MAAFMFEERLPFAKSSNPEDSHLDILAAAVRVLRAHEVGNRQGRGGPL